MSEHDYQFSATIESLDGCLLVRVAGDVDMSNAHELRAVLTDAGARSMHVIVDFSRVTFFDSHAILTLLRWSRDHIAAEGRAGVVYAPGGAFDQVLRVAGVPKAIPVFHSVEEAAGAFSCRSDL